MLFNLLISGLDKVVDVVIRFADDIKLRRTDNIRAERTKISANWNVGPNLIG